jgi:hypothetical protein
LLYEQIVVNFGVPDEIVTDRGRAFLANVLTSYMRKMGVKHRKTSAFHPRTNGKVENFNGTLGKMLAKAVLGARHKWDEFLPEALFNTRIRTHRATQFSPFKLVYGVDPKVPGDTAEPYILKPNNPRDNVEIRARLLEDLGQDRQASVIRAQRTAVQNKAAYDRLVKRDPLGVGDWVLLRREARLKFMSRWLGPYKIRQVGPNGTYQLEDPQGVVKPDWVHRDRLKRAIIGSQTPNALWSDETLEDLDLVFGQEGTESVSVPEPVG